MDLPEDYDNFTSSNVTMNFQHASYIAVELDTVDEAYFTNDAMEEDVVGNMHQANPENITLFEPFDPCQANTDMYDRFERFDIDGDGDTNVNVTFGDPTDIPETRIPSPPPAPAPPSPHHAEGENPNQHFETYVNQQRQESNEERQVQGAIRRKRKRGVGDRLDETTVVPSEIYQSWLQNATDISSRTGRKKKGPRSIMSRMKVSALMELPPMVLIDKASIDANRKVYYPAPLFALWTKSTQPPHDSPSARTFSPPPPETSPSHPPETDHFADQHNFEDFQSKVASQSVGSSVERQTAAVGSVEHLIGQLEANLPFRDELESNKMKGKEPIFTTPVDAGAGARFAASSSSGRAIPPHYSEMNSGQRSGSSLHSVPEDMSWVPDPDLATLHEKDPTPDQELLVETGPTQTQPPTIPQQLDPMTEAMRTHLKDHFQAPEASPFVSLNNISTGLNRKRAAMLFHQVCVLATRGSIKINQSEPYGDIKISKGPEMC
ncbi:Sister chromatid cohesion 1 protein 1 [Linum grandiflorum]